MIEKTKELFVMGVPKEHPELIGGAWVKDWHKRRVKKKIWFHHLINEDYYPHRIKLLRSFKFTSVKFIPKKYHSPNSLFIYDEGIMLGFTEPLVAIKVTGKEVAHSFKNYYKMLEKMSLKKAPQEKHHKLYKS